MTKFYRFTASWCQPCKALAKTLEGMQVSLPTYDVDTDEAKALMPKFNVRSVPTIVVESADGTFKSYVGASISKELKEAIELAFK